MGVSEKFKQAVAIMAQAAMLLSLASASLDAHGADKPRKPAASKPAQKRADQNTMCITEDGRIGINMVGDFSTIDPAALKAIADSNNEAQRALAKAFEAAGIKMAPRVGAYTAESLETLQDMAALLVTQPGTKRLIDEARESDAIWSKQGVQRPVCESAAGESWVPWSWSKKLPEPSVPAASR